MEDIFLLVVQVKKIFYKSLQNVGTYSITNKWILFDENFWSCVVLSLFL